jgi:chemotaxis protein MotB
MKKDLIKQVVGFKPWITVLMLFSLSACVSSGKYDELVKERDMVNAEKTELQSQIEQLRTEQQALSEKLTQTEQQKHQAQAEVNRQQRTFDNLQAAFAKEQQANQVKIEMMKSGIKVNLANEILFPSGSAELNAQGIDVLKRAAAELKKSPYQTLVAGYTDNVSISTALKEKYPSNWELAGARSTRVVRLLEEEGVPSVQLISLSFGENHPVASNDTTEGRSRNRRIEIILRPVAISLEQ